ncbi:MAG: XRE family transcriptional regulator [bacterium]|nr:XRE family transcriptional regulator [bacterium]MBU1917641.1 XRE family transcriptional regulator [bacterium]
MENTNENIHAELSKLGIGHKIKALREQKQISLEDFSGQIHVTTVLMAQIENNVVPPTIATLLNVSQILGVGIDYFFSQPDVMREIEITRKDERLHVPKSRETDSARLTYNYQALSYRLKGKRMEPFIVEFDTETEEKLVPLSHKGEEFIHCLEGEIEFITDEKTLTLQPGDSLYFYSSVPHVLRGIGPGKPKALAVLLPES